MLHRLGWIALTLLYLFLRLQNVPGVLTDEGVVLPGTDPYYRLHRIETMTRGDLTYPLHDANLDFPKGLDVPWPTGLDLIVAAPLKIANVRSQETIETVSALSVPFLSLPTLWGVGYIAAQIGGPGAGLAAGLLLSVFRGHIHATNAGSLDHHFLEGMFTLLALLLFLLRRRKETAARSLMLGLLLGLAPSFWPQAWIIGLFLALGFLMDRQEKTSGPTALLFFGASILSLAPLSLSSRFGSGHLSLFGFSWWPPLFYALLALLFLGTAFIRKESIRIARSFLVLIPLYAGALLFFLLFKNGLGALLAPFSSSIQAVRATQGSMFITSEAVSPAHVGTLRWFRMGYHAIVVGWLWFATMAFRRERWWLIGFVLIPLTLSMLQARFFTLASPILAIGIALLFVSWLPKRLSNRWVRSTLLAIGVLAIALPTLPLSHLTYRAPANPFLAPVQDAATFLAEEKERLALLPHEAAIASQWDFGHWFLHHTKSPVVANPFQSSSAYTTTSMLIEPGLEPLERFYQKHPVRYLAIELTPHRMLRWFQMTGKDPSLLKTDAVFDLLIARLHYALGENSEGEHPRNWRLLFASPFLSPDRSGGSALKIFERVPGARIQINDPQRELILTGQVQFHGGEFLFRQKGRLNQAGKMTWVVPYAQTQRGNVKFTGQYSIQDTQTRKLLITPIVSEEAVLQGNIIDLSTHPLRSVPKM